MLGRIAAVGILLVMGASQVTAQSLRGSSASMKKQNSIAQQQDYTFLVTGSDVRRFVDKGLLVPVQGNAWLGVADVSYPYTRPAVKLFVERLAPQYKQACGEKLVVTSLTRPLSRQPHNAHELSVHPAGMAVDLRQSKRRSCRTWLENTLKSLEAKGVLDATKERSPAHYHIAIYPNPYSRYVASLDAADGPKVAARTTPKIAKSAGVKYASMLPVSGATASKASGVQRYTVRAGDSLWSIARRFGTTIVDIKKANGMKASTIKPGQTLTIPGDSRAAAGTPAH